MHTLTAHKYKSDILVNIHWNTMSLVSVFGRVVLGRNHQTSAFASPSVDCFNYINHLLLVFQRPINFIVVSCSQINHYVFVSEEEHNSTWIIQLIPETQDRNAHYSIAAISNTLHLKFVLGRQGAYKKSGSLKVKHFI